MEQIYLEETKMVNYKHPTLQQLANTKQWHMLDTHTKIESIYEYVQNDILFGYNRNDQLSASEVLKDGYGQCNTKATLLMALLRLVGIPCRLHGFEVRKNFQKEALTPIIYLFSPKNIIHTWVEVYYIDTWYALEGVIIDTEYLSVVQKKNPGIKQFSGYAIATKDLTNPDISWNGQDTFIQKEAVTTELGIFDSPDAFFEEHQQHFGKVKNFLYSYLGTSIMTWNVQQIRKQNNKS